MKSEIIVFLINTSILIIGVYLFRKSEKLKDEAKGLLNDANETLKEAKLFYNKSKSEVIFPNLIILSKLQQQNIVSIQRILEMNYDDFIDYLESEHPQSIDNLRNILNKKGHVNHVKVIDVFLKNSKSNEN